MKWPKAPDLRQRFDDLAAKFTEGRKPGATPRSGRPGGETGDYWQSVQDLFTRDVTSRHFGDLVHRDAPDAFRYFARTLDLTALGRRPWYQRYPATGFQVFQAMAYRLSPARRVLFAVAVLVLLVAWVRQIVFWITGAGRITSTGTWLVVAATLLFVLLALELRDKLALKGDLEVARQIQFGLLPFEPYAKGGVSVEVHMRPANTVGGDYFDIIELPEGRIGLVLADVAGKGMPAALLMALLQGSLRTLLTAGHRGPELIATLNAHLVSNIPSNRLVTLFYAELDAAAGELRYVNAGHNAPCLIRPAGGVIERLPATSVALGVLKDAPMEAASTRLDAGDQVFLFTDGITEVFDVNEVEYGEERLLGTLRASHGATGRALIDAVLADVHAFGRDVPPRDDMTLMVVRRV